MLLSVNEKYEKKKIDLRLVRDIFSIPNKNYFHKGDIKEN
mgnify:CR=1 FL=1|tara:strand:+ start:837 stop:956 length:120 start_codon:yes stop_codon:yes gene_type:complete